jgi:WD40 repeat protein
LWQFCRNEAKAVLARRQSGFGSVAASLDGKLLPDLQTLASGSKNGELLFWDTVQAGAAREVVSIPGNIAAWRFADEAGDAVITVEGNGRVAERRGENYRIATTLLQIELGENAMIHSTVFLPDGRRLATGGSGNEAMMLWDVAGFERVLTLPAKAGQLRQAAFSRDGNVLGALSGSRGNSALLLWRAPSWEVMAAAEEDGRWR